MLDIKFLRQNPDVVKENIKKKFQDEKLPLVDEVIELDKRNREIKGEVEALRAEKNKVSKEIGACMAHGEKEKAEELKKKVQENAARMEELSAEEKEVEAKIKKDMMVIPISSIHLYRSVKTTARMLKLKNLANRLFRTLKSHTIQKLWKNSTESILKVQGRLPEMVSII